MNPSRNKADRNEISFLDMERICMALNHQDRCVLCPSAVLPVNDYFPVDCVYHLELRECLILGTKFMSQWDLE